MISARNYIWRGTHTFLCLQNVVQELLYYGMEIVEIKRETHDYELTMKHWAMRFDNNREKIIERWGKEIYRAFRMLPLGRLQLPSRKYPASLSPRSAEALLTWAPPKSCSANVSFHSQSCFRHYPLSQRMQALGTRLCNAQNYYVDNDWAQNRDKPRGQAAASLV
jgi:Mycolic acid cyclopropane synthetase